MKKKQRTEKPSLSHEIGTQLAITMATTELLLAEKLGSLTDAQRDAISKIREAQERIDLLRREI